MISQRAGTVLFKDWSRRLSSEEVACLGRVDDCGESRGPMADVHQRKLEMKERVWLGYDSVISSPGSLFHFSENGKNNYEYFRTRNKQVKD